MIRQSDHKKTLFKCDVTGLVGVYVGQKETDSLNSNQNLRQIVYIPLQDLNEGLLNRWKGVKQYKKLWRVTNTKYPKKGILGPKPVQESNREDGIFKMQVVATQDRDGKNSHRSRFVGDELENRVDRLEAELSEARKDYGLKDVENLDEDDDQDSEFKRDERGRPPADRLDEEEFRRGSH